MGNERFLVSNFSNFLVTESFLAWIRIRIVFAWIRIRIKVRSGSGIRSEFFHVLDADPYPYDTDPQHC